MCWCAVSGHKQGSNYKEGLTPVLSLLTEGSRRHRHIRRFIKAQVTFHMCNICQRCAITINEYFLSNKNTQEHIYAVPLICIESSDHT